MGYAHFVKMPHTVFVLSSPVSLQENYKKGQEKKEREKATTTTTSKRWKEQRKTRRKISFWRWIAEQSPMDIKS